MFILNLFSRWFGIIADDHHHRYVVGAAFLRVDATFVYLARPQPAQPETTQSLSPA
jgi:hypothetical protein